MRIRRPLAHLRSAGLAALRLKNAPLHTPAEQPQAGQEWAAPRLDPHYLSTACHHAVHEGCRFTCKFCARECVCACHDPEVA